LTAMIERPEYAESLGRRAINIRRDLSVENIGLMWKRVIDGGDVLQ
jgi:GalNAc-alpha-(1->4)-GalNAc-alpha-(1->3)-diNAcBac-PP-undecaprenol alpha-1,4-N-acetyl-D-galactosaminyltransferase